ncbi:RNA-binding protein [uncultured Marinococcus sp.]|uniref:YlmH family RNA-binding protein n=1 Tax=uncultured Marinococcus sp. TaxID=487012 RepID=UPI0026178C05|nr:YlmH/Sll1252 family protein [uncultured Marinococcus sp.]
MNMLEHFRPEERAWVEQASDWKEAVETNFERRLTDFLDPRERDILASVIGKDETVHYAFAGGSDDAERKRALIYPFYEQPELEDFQLILFEISYPQKFASLEHKDVLGALMGIGLKREKFGDILEGEGCFQFVAAAEVRSYIELNLPKIANVSVTPVEKPFSAMLPIEEQWVERETTISSLRLDTFMAEAYRLSRSKTLPFIEKAKVRVNWKKVDQSSYMLRPGDYVSVRGLGRSKLMEVLGRTKKDKQRIVYGIKEQKRKK